MQGRGGDEQEEEEEGDEKEEHEESKQEGEQKGGIRGSRASKVPNSREHWEQVRRFHIRHILIQHRFWFRSDSHKKLQKDVTRINNDSRKALLMSRPLPCERTRRFYLPGFDCNAGTVNGVISFLDQLKQHFVDPWMRSKFILSVNGDLGVCRLIKRASQERGGDQPEMTLDDIHWNPGSFHFSLNANLSGVRHYAGPEDFNNPTCLRRAASVVNGRTWNVTHSVYNTSRELREIKLVAHVLDYFRSFQELCELAELTDERFEGFRRKGAAELSKGNAGDEVLAMDLFFADGMLVERKSDRAVRDGDPGCMWEVYRRWLLIFRGMGMASYANLVMEMFVKFETMPQKLRDFYEATWLINSTGMEGKWEAADIALEHDIGAIKKAMNNSKGNWDTNYSSTSVLSGTADVRRSLLHSVPRALGGIDRSRPHQALSIHNEVISVLQDLITEKVLPGTPGRRVDPVSSCAPYSSSNAMPDDAEGEHEDVDIFIDEPCAGAGSGRDGRKTSFHVVDFEEEGMRKDLDRVRVATNLAEGVSGTGPATHVGETIPGMAESETQVPTAEELDLQIEEGSSE
ncbi:hypothetical protein C359_04547 [Cryptococcus neoformans Bt120]|nr:hypothetical protein C359_04547 [Cryptococcus neoformans var. grubii Bt120]